MYGVPHEFITGEYKGTFEGDYDFTLELVESLKEWGTIPLWSETYSGPIGVFATNFHVFEQAFLYLFTGNLALSIKILQVLQMFIAGMGMYLLSLYLFGDRVGALFSAVLYMFTPFYLGHLLSYLHYTGVYLLAPMVYLLILKTVKGEGIQYPLLLSMVMTYSLLSHPQNVFIGGIFYVLFFIMVGGYEVVSSPRPHLYTVLKRIAFSGILVVLITFLLSAFTVLPTLVHNYPYLRTSWVKGAEELVKIDYGHIGTHSQTLLATISLQHWPWLMTPIIGGEYPPWYFMMLYMLPFVLFVFSLPLRFTWITVVFLVIAVISVQIALGVNTKLSLFNLASSYLPFFGMSRTPYTYINHAILVFCLFSSVTFLWLSERILACIGTKPSTNNGQSVKWILFFVLALPYLFAGYHYATRYNWTLIPAKQPRYLNQVWHWLGKNNKARTRVIETCGIPTAMLLGQRMLPNQVDLLERFYQKDYLPRYLSLLGFEYIITPRLHSMRRYTFDRRGYRIPSVFDNSENLEEFYSALTTEYFFIYERLKEDPAFALYTAGTKDVAIFKNLTAFDDYILYPARVLMILGGTDGYDILSLERLNRGGRIAPVFIAQSENLKRIDELKDIAEAIVLHNTDAQDLTMLTNRDHILFLKPRVGNPKNWDLAFASYGIQQPFPQHDHSIGNSLFGELTFADYALTTARRNSRLTYTAILDDTDSYTIMLRTYGGKNHSTISFHIDGTKTGTYRQDTYRGFKWITVWKGVLKRGTHTFKITVDEDKKTFIDSLAIVKTSDIKGMLSEVRGDFRGIPTVYIYNKKRFRIIEEGRLSSTIDILDGGTYTPVIRLTTHSPPSDTGMIELIIDGKRAGGIRYGDLDKKREFILSQIELGSGVHTIDIVGLREGIYLDLFTLFGKVKWTREDISIAFDYTKTGPASYNLRVASHSPFLVVFNETNYPGWHLKVGDNNIEPIIVNMFMNGFILPGGEFNGRIYYSNTIQNLGILLSVATFFAVCTAVLWLSIRNFFKRKETFMG